MTTPLRLACEYATNLLSTICLKCLSCHTHENKNIPNMIAGNATKITQGDTMTGVHLINTQVYFFIK